MGIYRGVGGTGDSNTDATITEVTQKAAAAANSATASANSADAASSSASGAGTSATASANSATASANSATASGNSATASGSSASASLASKNTSAAQAAISTTKASQAASSATASANSATASGNSATASANSATASANSATASANSATASGNSASTSTTKANESAASASTASTKATLATTKATAAANSASDSNTSAGQAATQATNSANSATASAASLTTFQGQYVSQSSAPSNPSTGDLWFDTSSNTMKVYSGSGFINAGSSVNGTQNSVQYTASANQTSFNATYDAGYLQVYLNGIRLDTGDYTATNGSTVVLDIGATANDIVFIQSFGTFSLSDHYNKTQADARFLGLAGGAMTGPLTTNSTIDGRDVAADGVLATNAMPKGGGAFSGAVTTNSTFDGRDVAADGVLATNAMPKAGGAFTGAVTTNSTIDGRDVAADGVLATNAMPKAGGAFSGDVTNTSTGSFQVSQGTTAQRPAGTANGRLRYNSTEGAFEGHTAAGWGEIGGGGPSLGTNSIIRTNALTISENITIPASSNGMSAGPITIADGNTVTVNGTWSIV